MRMIHTRKVKVRETNGDFVITPIRDESAECPLLGMFADGKISSEKFMARKQAEKVVEFYKKASSGEVTLIMNKLNLLEVYSNC